MIAVLHRPDELPVLESAERARRKPAAQTEIADPFEQLADVERSGLELIRLVLFAALAVAILGLAGLVLG